MFSVGVNCAPGDEYNLNAVRESWPSKKKYSVKCVRSVRYKQFSAFLGCTWETCHNNHKLLHIFDLTAEVYLNIICDLNLLKNLPPLPPLALPYSNAPPNIEIRHINKHFTHGISPHYLSRAIHAAVPPSPPRLERPLLPHHPHHRLDLAPHV